MSFGRALALLALLCAGACRDKMEPQRSAEPERRRAEEAQEVEAELARQPDEVTSPVSAPDQEAPPSAALLPVPEDFQAETAAAIVRTNYLNELEKLETEVRADEL
jgi:hypothetical protein